MTVLPLITRITLIFVINLTIVGCVSLPNPLQRQPITPPSQWQSNLADNTPELKEFRQGLLSLFNDPQLKRLINQSLALNPDLQSFSYQLRAAGLLHQQSVGSRLPQLNLNLTKTKNKSILGISQSYEFGLGVNWEIDLWGRLANISDAAKSDFLAEQYNFQQTKNQLVVILIRQWNQVTTTRELLQLERKNNFQLETLLKVQQDKLRYGVITAEDISQTKINLANSLADIDALYQRLQLQENQLKLLAGGPEAIENLVPLDLAQINQPPVSLPAKVLAARPDVNASFLKLKSLDYQTRAAYKALLPSIRLEGSYFRSADKQSELSNGPNLWSLIGGITQPIFAGGRLKAEAEISSLNAQAHWWQYKKTVLNAITEVENALATEQSLSRQITQLKAAKIQSQQLLNISEQKYRDGSIDILDLVFIRRQSFNSEARLIQALASQMDNRVVLALALGLGTETS